MDSIYIQIQTFNFSLLFALCLFLLSVLFIKYLLFNHKKEIADFVEKVVAFVRLWSYERHKRGLNDLYWKFNHEKRKAEIAKQLPYALRVISSAIKSGMDLSAVLRIARDESKAPLKNVLNKVLFNMDYGVEVAESLELVARDIGSEEWDLFVFGIALQKDTGGDLVYIIDQVLRTIQDRQSTERELRAATASGKMSGMLIAALVPIGLVFFYFFSPEFISVLFETTPGQLALVAAIVLEVVGAYWIWKVTQIEF